MLSIVFEGEEKKEKIQAVGKELEIEEVKVEVVELLISDKPRPKVSVKTSPTGVITFSFDQAMKVPENATDYS